jgi:hypothetical protein
MSLILPGIDQFNHSAMGAWRHRVPGLLRQSGWPPGVHFQR